MRTSAAGSDPLAPAGACTRRDPQSRPQQRGFTLLELLVVLAIIAAGTATVSVALRDSAQTALERDAQRLAALFEAARAQSRAAGVPVQWQATAQGFSFSGLAPQPQTQAWLSPETRVQGTPRVTLGPEPIIGPQSVVLLRQDQPDHALRVATDGLRPFSVQPPEAP